MEVVKKMNQMKCKLEAISQFTGKPLKETFTVEKTESTIKITDAKGKVLVSLAPFFNGGSVWLSEFNDFIMDWGTREQVISGVSTSEILGWKEDSEKLEKIREAQRIVDEVAK